MMKREGASSKAVTIASMDRTTQSEDQCDVSRRDPVEKGGKEEGRISGRKRKAEDESEEERGCGCGNVAKNKKGQVADDWPVCQTCTDSEEQDTTAYCDKCGDNYNFVCVQDGNTTICVEWCERGGRFVCCHYFLQKDPCGCEEEDCSDSAKPTGRGFACTLCHEAMNNECDTGNGFDSGDEYYSERECDIDE